VHQRTTALAPPIDGVRRDRAIEQLIDRARHGGRRVTELEQSKRDEVLTRQAEIVDVLCGRGSTALRASIVLHAHLTLPLL
jgi:hypothetical protein